MPMTNAAEYLERTAARVPDKIAFSDASGSLTFGQLLTRARALGTVLAGLPGCKTRPWPCSQAGQYRALRPCKAFCRAGIIMFPSTSRCPKRACAAFSRRCMPARSSFRNRAARRRSGLRTARRLSAWRKRRKPRRTMRSCKPGASRSSIWIPCTCSLPPARPERRRASLSPTAPFWTLPTG